MNIQFTGNISGAIGRLERFQTRLGGGQLFDPAQNWIGIARRMATVACEAVVRDPAEEPWISPVVAGVAVEVFGSGMIWTAGKVAQAGQHIDALVATGRIGPLFDWGSRDALRDVVRQWVAAPEVEGGKRRDERDVGNTDEEIIYRIMRVLRRNSSSEFDEAGAASLARHIQDFADRRGAGTISPELLDRLLRAIFEVWRMHLMSQLGPIAQQAIQAAWR